MVTAFNLVYSAAAVKRLLGSAFEVVRIEKWWKVCLVIFKGCRPRFISRAWFIAHFVEWRKEQAKKLTVNKDEYRGNIFYVQNKGKQSVYRVMLFIGGLKCECKDFDNQSKFLGKACCKHGYAVLGSLGFQSLSDYISAQGSGGYIRQ